ncbi:MAG TPA: type 1 glutamine amidotransferase domain-containing protein [Opitutaceae bacterium]|jgi:protease I
MNKNSKDSSERSPVVAILLTDGFEQVEMTKPREALEKEGYRTKIVSPKKDTVEGVNHMKPGDKFKVDVPLSDADAEDYDALLLPGGVTNPDALRQEEDAVQFVSSFFEAGKPVAAICHGPIMLIESDVIEGRTLTSYPSIRTDLENAGAKWVDRSVCEDGNLVTSRKPDDIPDFNRAMLGLFSRSAHAHPA